MCYYQCNQAYRSYHLLKGALRTYGQLCSSLNACVCPSLAHSHTLAHTQNTRRLHRPAEQVPACPGVHAAGQDERGARRTDKGGRRVGAQRRGGALPARTHQVRAYCCRRCTRCPSPKTMCYCSNTLHSPHTQPAGRPPDRCARPLCARAACGPAAVVRVRRAVCAGGSPLLCPPPVMQLFQAPVKNCPQPA
jgi:hypothetical protein